MSMTLRSGILCLVVALHLAGCGGGGDSGPANTPPSANAGAAQTVLAGAAVTLDGSASSDADNDALTYSWQLSSRPTGSVAVLVGATTARPSFSVDVAGSYTATLTVSDGKGASATSAVTVTALATNTLTIQASTAEPLAGVVQFSLSGPSAGAPVSWYVDLNLIGTGDTVAWATSTTVNGSHGVVARVQLAPGNTLDIRRTVVVANSSVTLVPSVSGTMGNITVDIRAASPFGITSVSAFLDGVVAGTLAQPNACSRFCNGNDLFRFVVDGIAAGSGNHTLRVVATDASGSSNQINVPVPVSNAPALTVTAPLDGAIVFGSLTLAGSYSLDRPGLVTVTARLGDVQFMQTSNTDIGASFDLSGVPPGTYTLTVQAAESGAITSIVQRTVLVASAPALAMRPAFSLGSNGRLLVADGNQLLYAAEDLSVRLRDMVSGSEVVLQGAAALASTTDWQLSGGRVTVQGQGNDCSLNFACIYHWQADGTRSNLTAANPFAGSNYQGYPVAHDGYVLWSNFFGTSRGSLTLYNITAGSYTQVLAPASVFYIGNTRFSFALVGGVVNVFYWGQTGGSGTTSSFDIYRWTSDTSTSTQLSSTGRRSIYPQTDGVRAAWSQAPVTAEFSSAALLVQPVGAASATTVSATMSSFVLRDGVLAWAETNGGSRAVKAATVASTSTLSALNSSSLVGAGGGFVVYGEQGKLYSWNAATGRTALRLDVVPTQPLVSGNTVYFFLGETRSVYKLTLD